LYPSPYKLALELQSLQQIYVAEETQPKIFVQTSGYALFPIGSLLSAVALMITIIVHPEASVKVL
jgi:hypothetical protein